MWNVMYYVYLLKSTENPNQTYVGFTTNPSKRLKVHNNGGCPHTSKYKPWTMPITISFLDKNRALEFELYLKTGSGRSFSKKRLF